MSINWQKLESDIKNYLELGREDTSGDRYSIKSTAQYIEDLYLTEIRTNATDIFLNSLATINFGESLGLHVSLENGFGTSLNTNNTSLLNNTAIQGVLDNWSGAQFSILIPAPGMALGVSNTVTFPGSISTLSPSTNSKTGDLFSQRLINSLRMHSSTIQGVFIGVTTAGNPISVPWVGIL